jgi:hypothetical protein
VLLHKPEGYQLQIPHRDEKAVTVPIPLSGDAMLLASTTARKPLFCRLTAFVTLTIGLRQIGKLHKILDDPNLADVRSTITSRRLLIFPRVHIHGRLERSRQWPLARDPPELP